MSADAELLLKRWGFQFYFGACAATALLTPGQGGLLGRLFIPICASLPASARLVEISSFPSTTAAVICVSTALSPIAIGTWWVRLSSGRVRQMTSGELQTAAIVCSAALLVFSLLLNVSGLSAEVARRNTAIPLASQFRLALAGFLPMLGFAVTGILAILVLALRELRSRRSEV